MMKYETYENESGKTFVKRFNDDGSESHIPADPANSDYQAYLDRDKPKAALSTPIVTE